MRGTIERRRFVCRAVKKHIWKKQGLNITLQEYDALVAGQGGLCAVCERPSRRALCLDHNHATKQVRALLCDPCNTAVGLLGDSAERCNRMAQYLDNYTHE